ncbi:MAG: hypothetical protein HZA81_02340 [Candidatus Taylorbacteria bacterium]|nr:hypothetical protein [Candidatus Taylorbacteria bacterium]
MKRIIIAIVALLALGWASYALTRGDGPLSAEPSSVGQTGGEAESYSSGRFGLSFEYPKGYYLEEREVSAAERLHYQIVLTEDTEWNRRLRSGEVPPTEGPTSITIDVFQNDLDQDTARGFITGSNNSNYKLGDGVVATTTRGSLEGLEYSWSGLYEGRSFVVASPRYIYMFSVTRLDPSDRILKDFNEVMETVSIE